MTDHINENNTEQPSLLESVHAQLGIDTRADEAEAEEMAQAIAEAPAEEEQPVVEQAPVVKAPTPAKNLVADMDNASSSRPLTSEELEIVKEHREKAASGTEEAPAAPKKFNIDEAHIDLANLTIDMNPSELKLSMATEVDKFDLASATTNVILTRSAYSAQMRGLNLANKTRMLASSDNLLDERRKFYRLLYDHIQQMSTESKPPFEKWLRQTAYTDVEIMCYGIYCQTFGVKPVEFTLTCPKCENENKIALSANQIARSEDPELGPRLHGIINGIRTDADIEKHSLVGKPNRCLFPDSKAVVDFTIPSIQDYLEMVDILGRDVDLGELLARVMFIKNLMIPNYALYEREGRLEYLAITTRREVFERLGNMSTDDGAFFEEEINKVFNKYDVSFEIPSGSCQKCGNPMEKIALNMERMLFLRAADRLKAS